MPKVGPSFVDSPVTVNRERVCITVGFRTRLTGPGPLNERDGVMRISEEAGEKVRYFGLMVRSAISRR
jgi:hypothetical protein